MTRPTEFYDNLPAKCCDRCGNPMEELADCYSPTCVSCRGLTFYPLGPAEFDRNAETAPAV